MTRVELVTSPLPRVCSTTELHRRRKLKSRSWIFIKVNPKPRCEKWAELDLNQRRRSQRIYSPPPLTTRTPTHVVSRLLIVSQGLENTNIFFDKVLKCLRGMGNGEMGGIGHWAWGNGEWHKEKSEIIRSALVKRV